MLVGLVVVLVVVPVVELAAMVAVADRIGVGATVGLLLAVSLGGVWLVWRQGLGVLRRVRASVDAGRMPAAELLDGSLLLAAGALLIVPGFVTDALGILLVIPPVRAGVRAVLARRYERRLRRAGLAGAGAGAAGGATFVTGRIRTGAATYDSARLSVVDVREATGEDGPREGHGR